MAARDFVNTQDYAFVMHTATGATSTATGTYIDSAGYAGVAFVLSRASTTASTVHTMTLLTATATSGGATATAATLVVADAATASGIAAGTAKVQYIGPASERYMTVKVSSSVATGAYTVTAIKGGPIKQP